MNNIIGPNPCGYCGGEYGEHAPSCPTLSRTLQIGFSSIQAIKAELDSAWDYHQGENTVAAFEKLHGALTSLVREVEEMRRRQVNR